MNQIYTSQVQICSQVLHSLNPLLIIMQYLDIYIYIIVKGRMIALKELGILFSKLYLNFI